MFSLFASAEPPPFLLDEANAEVGLKVVFFGSDPRQVEHEFKAVADSWPKDSKSELQTASAPTVPEAGTAFFVQRLMPASASINGHRVRLHAFASTAPIVGPASAGQAVVLNQAACVVVLDGSTEATITALDALLTKVATKPKRPPVVIFVGKKPKSVPKGWTTMTAASAAEAVEAGVHKVATLIK